MNFSRHGRARGKRGGLGWRNWDESRVTIRVCCHRNQVDTISAEERKTRQLYAVMTYIHCVHGSLNWSLILYKRVKVLRTKVDF